MKYQKAKVRRNKKKELLIKKLKNSPVVEVACKNTGISRSSYYRWRDQDQEFAQECDKAIAQGNSLINDMAESQLISAIRDKNLTAIIYWLKHHHPAYLTSVRVDARHRIEDDRLTKEQEQLISKALDLISDGKEVQNEKTK